MGSFPALRELVVCHVQRLWSKLLFSVVSAIANNHALFSAIKIRETIFAFMWQPEPKMPKGEFNLCTNNPQPDCSKTKVQFFWPSFVSGIGSVLVRRDNCAEKKVGQSTSVLRAWVARVWTMENRCLEKCIYASLVMSQLRFMSIENEAPLVIFHSLAHKWRETAIMAP